MCVCLNCILRVRERMKILSSEVICPCKSGNLWLCSCEATCSESV